MKSEPERNWSRDEWIADLFASRNLNPDHDVWIGWTRSLVKYFGEEADFGVMVVIDGRTKTMKFAINPEGKHYDEPRSV